MDSQEFLKHQISTLETVLKEDIEYHGKDYFKEVYFIPNNLTQVEMSTVDLSTTFFGKHLQYPICVGSLISGNKKFSEINKRIGEFCEKYQIAHGIGDEIHGIQHNVGKNTIESYQVARSADPDGLIFGNLSAKYLNETEYYLDAVANAISLIDADALEIYVDPLIDVLWNYDKPGTVGFLQRLRNIVSSTDVPIIMKTLCTGFSNSDVRALWDCGVAGINIEGVGGTSFPRIETLKHLTLAEKQQDPPIKFPYDFFGTPSVWSMLDIVLRKENKDIPLIVGGGIRDGRQAIKALALGADLVSIAYPILIQIIEDFGYPEENNLDKWFHRFIHQMRLTMLLFGAQNLKELRQIVKNRVVILGKTKEWIEGRHLTFPPKHIREI